MVNLVQAFNSVSIPLPPSPSTYFPCTILFQTHTHTHKDHSRVLDEDTKDTIYLTQCPWQWWAQYFHPITIPYLYPQMIIQLPSKTPQKHTALLFWRRPFLWTTIWKGQLLEDGKHLYSQRDSLETHACQKNPTPLEAVLPVATFCSSKNAGGWGVGSGSGSRHKHTFKGLAFRRWRRSTVQPHEPFGLHWYAHKIQIALLIAEDRNTKSKYKSENDDFLSTMSSMLVTALYRGFIAYLNNWTRT